MSRPTQHMNREMLLRKREIAQSTDLHKVLCSANGTPNKGLGMYPPLFLEMLSNKGALCVPSTSFP